MNVSDLLKKLNELNQYEPQKKTPLDKTVDYLRNTWWKFIVILITVGIMVLFLFGFVYDKNITVGVMNSWVGIILGLVATVIGVISMILSFYNLDQSIKTQKETLAKIDEIKKEIIENVEKSSDRAIEAYEKSQNSNETRQIKYDEKNKKGGWVHVNKE